MYYWSGAVLLHCTKLHCIDLQWIAGLSHTLHPTELTCTVFWWTALLCTELHYAVLHCTTLHCTKLHCTSLHWIAQYCIALHYITLYSTALHCTAICKTILKQANKKSCKNLSKIGVSSVILFAHVERVSVSRMHNFYISILSFCALCSI